MAVTLDDGSTVPIDYRDNGTFSFPISRAGQPYRMLVTADGSTIEYQHTASQLELASLLAGRPNRRPLSYAQLTFGFDAAPPGGLATSTAFLASTGLWTYTNTATYGPVAFDWRLASFVTPAVAGMLDADEHDRIYTIEYGSTTVAGGPAYSLYSKVGMSEVTLAANTSVPLATPIPVGPASCIHVQTGSATARARVMAALPRTASTTQTTEADWVVFAAPAPDQLSVVGLIPIAQVGYMPAMDLDIMPVFYNPYPAPLIVEAGAFEFFDLALPGATPVQVVNSLRRYMPVESMAAASCPSATLADAHPTIGIPGTPTIGGIALDQDDQSVQLDLKHDVPVTWQIVDPGPIDFTTVFLERLENVNGTTVVTTVRPIDVVGQSAVLDPSLLEPGQTYAILLSGVIGRPMAAIGDYATVSSTLEQVTSWSHTFVVAAAP
jgi:hypothetical protein